MITESKKTWRQRLDNTFIRPRQLILVDSHGNRPSRSFNIRLITFIVVAAVALLGTFVAGLLLKHGGGNNSLIPQHLQLQRQYDQAQVELAQADATNEVQGRQLEELKAELQQMQGMNDELKQRLRLLESILEARKARGVQLINPTVEWAEDGSLQYDFTLVKGGSYPRYVIGNISITAQSPEGESVELQLDKESPRLPFRVETHTFLHGHAVWEQAWHPEKLTVTAYDKRDRELFKTEIPVNGAVK